MHHVRDCLLPILEKHGLRIGIIGDDGLTSALAALDAAQGTLATVTAERDEARRAFDAIGRSAEAIRAEERERCARLADAEQVRWFSETAKNAAIDIARDIRALKDPSGSPAAPTGEAAPGAAENRPRIGAALLVFDNDGRLLLGRRGKEPNKGKWIIPGGGIKRGETWQQAGLRETLEETGLDVTILGPPVLHEIITPDEHRIVIFARAGLANGYAAAGDDITALSWFRLDLLPDDAAPSVRAALDAIGSVAPAAAPTPTGAPPDLLTLLRDARDLAWLCKRGYSDGEGDLLLVTGRQGRALLPRIDALIEAAVAAPTGALGREAPCGCDPDFHGGADDPATPAAPQGEQAEGNAASATPGATPGTQS